MLFRRKWDKSAKNCFLFAKKGFYYKILSYKIVFYGYITIKKKICVLKNLPGKTPVFPIFCYGIYKICAYFSVIIPFFKDISVSKQIMKPIGI